MRLCFIFQLDTIYVETLSVKKQLISANTFHETIPHLYCKSHCTLKNSSLCRDLQHKCPNIPATVVAGSEINIALTTIGGAGIGGAERIEILALIAIGAGADLEAVIGQIIGTVIALVLTGAHIAKEKGHMSEIIMKALTMIDQDMTMETNMIEKAQVIGILTSMIGIQIERVDILVQGGRIKDMREEGPRIRI